MAESLTERAYVGLRDRVLTLELPPGAPLNESELAKELGVGRTPIREAIKRLARDSLVEVYPRRGTFVSDIQITDLAAISEVRMELEGLAARLAAERYRATEDGPELKRLMDTLDASGLEDTAMMQLDADIHRFIYRTARNRYLEETLTGYFQLSFRIWNLGVRRLASAPDPEVQSNVKQHRGLLSAVRERQPERAREHLIEHLLAFQHQMRALL